ncbi:hypothetical protein M431DRAFT_227204 [Trichoderma harzianum CBS 226.95]|uniref:Uncharacterized protein n=1 Tax=Trichoderma harzianum CBS 226.95 TaxID=983964 RepID=A0A2T4A422_TRIHA|nr:hypothetical protein M431DRAFT_227204 [Trichoderma harzianum CBS 226.95]PTB51811.1 hypothetical protein M431DRAFT_227204 [Trichoderma harzianum CBS 226.95]
MGALDENNMYWARGWRRARFLPVYGVGQWFWSISMVCSRTIAAYFHFVQLVNCRRRASCHRISVPRSVSIDEILDSLQRTCRYYRSYLI